MKKIINILVFLAIYSLSFSEIKIFVDDYNPTIKQNIILTVEFLNEPKSEYEIEGIDNFEVISRGSRSNYNTLNNKRIKYSKSDIYILSPKKVGKISLIAKTKNKTISNSIVLQVAEKIENSLKEPKLFLETTHYKRDYYYGEKIPFVEKVIIKTSVSNYNYISTPVFNGFTIKNITPRDGRGFAIPKRVTVNGKEQIELVLFRSILEPESFGRKTIKTGGISIAELTKEDEEKNPVYLGFEEFNLNILPLPEENKPENFQGVVGELKGNYHWAKENIDGRETFILNLKLYGSVNLDKLEKIVFSEDEKFDVKETTTIFEEHVLDHVYSAERNYVIIFIPKKAGEIILPKIKIPFFNPIEQKYDEFVISGFGEKENEKNYSREINKDNLKVIFTENTNINNPAKNEDINNKNLQQTKIINIVSEEKGQNVKIFIIYFLIAAVFLEGIYIIKLKKDIKKKEEHGTNKW